MGISSKNNLISPSNPDFWRELAPELHICDPEFIGNQKSIIFDSRTLKAIDSNLLDEGYTRFQPKNWETNIKNLAKNIEKLNDKNLLPVFSFVYDEYWLIFAKLRDALAYILGSDYKIMPAFWAWCLLPSKDSIGFPPHRDRGRSSLFQNGAAKSLTIWISLTEANLDNGCICLLPSNLDPNYNSERESEYSYETKNIKSQPCQPGTVLCWNQAILHWGGRSSESAKNPRISISLEFQRSDIPPFNRPLLSNNSLPTFDLRIKLIALQILQYKHLYPLSPELEKFIVKMGLSLDK